MNKKHNNAFTLVEIIMVIAVIGIIAMIAIPRLMNFRDDAQKASEDATIAAVQSGINISNAAEEARK